MILMLNCSYKAKDSNTQYFLELLKKELESSRNGDHQYQTCTEWWIL